MFRPPRGPRFRPGGGYGGGYGRPRGYGYGRPRGGYGRDRGIGIDPYLFLMLFNTLGRVLSVPGVPVVTLGVAGAQLLLFFRELLPLALRRSLRAAAAGDVCLQPRRIVERLEVWRLLTGGVFHADQYHVCYNMASLLQKGAEMERSRGPIATAYYLAASYALCQLILLAMSVALWSFTEVAGPYDTCTVGFSGVLFALKILLTHGQRGSTAFFGFNVPIQYLAWSELLYIQLFVPRSSFLGHLAGILAGLVLVRIDENGGPSAVLGAFPPAPPPASRRETQWGSGRASERRGAPGGDGDSGGGGGGYADDDPSRPSSSRLPTEEEMRQARLRRFEGGDSKKSR